MTVVCGRPPGGTWREMTGEGRYTLIDADGKPCRSETPGTFGGHRGSRIYGRLDCPSARRAIANGHYVGQRVFFADEQTAVAAGYRPCGRCMRAWYACWKADPEGYRASVLDRAGGAPD
jgi:hypothetical protein